MATDTQTGAPELTGTVLLYSRPEPLNAQAHAKLGLTPVERPFDFVRSTHAVPLTVTEFGPASLNYPIIFTGDEYQPLAVMSIRQNDNMFIADNGYFDQDTYAPAYIRRYPFVLANDQQTGQLVVCIERDAEAVQVNGQIPLFENGQPSTFTQQAIEFCTSFEAERQRTASFVEVLKGLDLFELKEAMFTPMENDVPGEPVKLADYFGVSEEKLNKLPAEKLAELRDTGALQQIYTHLNSLLNWDKLVGRTMRKDTERGTLPPAANA